LLSLLFKIGFRRPTVWWKEVSQIIAYVIYARERWNLPPLFLFIVLQLVFGATLSEGSFVFTALISSNGRSTPLKIGGYRWDEFILDQKGLVSIIWLASWEV
jgi:hypothetical protein